MVVVRNVLILKYCGGRIDRISADKLHVDFTYTHKTVLLLVPKINETLSISHKLLTP